MAKKKGLTAPVSPVPCQAAKTRRGCQLGQQCPYSHHPYPTPPATPSLLSSSRPQFLGPHTSAPTAPPAKSQAKSEKKRTVPVVAGIDRYAVAANTSSREIRGIAQPLVSHGSGGLTISAVSLGGPAATKMGVTSLTAVVNVESAHDSDDIAGLPAVPTTAELIHPHLTALPANYPNSPHHLAQDSIEKILDVQYRLLRADATYTFKAGVSCLIKALGHPPGSPEQFHLARLIKDGGGQHSTQLEGDKDSFPVITNVEYVGFGLDPAYGFTVRVRVDAPPGPPRSKNGFLRWRFWDESQRLPLGGLVAIVTREADGQIDIAPAVLATYAPGIKFVDRAEEVPGLEFDLAFCDPRKGLRAAQGISGAQGAPGVTRLLVECPTLWEAVRPFLESLKAMNSATLPCARYIKHGDLSHARIALPGYSSLPSFQWNMESLLKPNTAAITCMMDPRSPNSVASARATLHASGKLDQSQSDAVIEAITREMALIQGPPGTGKTFTGVELMRLLVSNNVGPIMLLAYTNHALDHILRAVIDSNVTQAIVRLGTRSKDEVVSRRCLKSRERRRTKSKLHKIKRAHAIVMRGLEAQMKQVSANLVRTEPSPEQVRTFMHAKYTPHIRNIDSPPTWISEGLQHQLAEVLDDWQKVGGQPPARTLWDYWLSGRDIKLLEALGGPLQPHADDSLLELTNRFTILDVLEGSNAIDDQWSKLFISSPTLVPPSRFPDSSVQEDDLEGSGPEGQLTLDDALQSKRAFLAFFKLPFLPGVSTSCRDLALLFADHSVWNWSLEERQRFTANIKITVKATLDEGYHSRIASLLKQYEEVQAKHDRARDEIRLSILQSMKVVGATTTGAAKLANVIQSWGPKILIVEEAGQVLEAHIHANLCPSIQHVIAIGDPLQLRPIVNCHDFSMNSPKGKELYRFDVSLMERLAAAGLPMSQLLVQRRMRPTISSLIRNTLYPRLMDHPLVCKYPYVQGMSKNVFFLDHRHGESRGGKDGTSKSNDFEVEMACDLALHFLKQGCYSQEGDIVVLCAYLGQLKKMQQALARRRVTVILDERDQLELSRQTGEGQSGSMQPKHVNANQQIYLRTVDNFQGEEAKIVILSLVRNDGKGNDAAPGTIGFLSFNNRVNVAMSRAKHGMYIMGNAPQLASRSEMWRSVVGDLKKLQALGSGWPLACALHPQEQISASEAGDVERLAPDGGCQRPCEKDMACGHRCPRRCHPDDPHHRHVRCEMPCERKHAACGHACQKECYAECGPCTIPRGPYRLPCGHIVEVPCYQTGALHAVRCTEQVERQLTKCEHLISLACGDDVRNVTCAATCGQPTDCCGKPCLAKCGDCQKLNLVTAEQSPPQEPCAHALEENAIEPIIRSKHASHLCTDKHPICNHQCGAPCHGQTEHPTCPEKCIQQCSHKRCGKKCGELCAPCEEPCTWQCEHHKCALPCFMPCNRLPCDEPCKNELSCGHPCPSICGESCDRQICTDPECNKSRRRLWQQRIEGPTGLTLREACESAEMTRLLTLSCGHVFTPHYLDQHVGLDLLYEAEPQQPGNSVYTGLKSLQSASVGAPSCPLCRVPITSPRYGRLTKWTLLDRQIQLSISIAESAVKSHRHAANDIDHLRLARTIRFSLTAASLSRHLRLPDRAQIDALLRLHPSDKTAVPAEIFHEKCGEIFAITGPLAVTWRKVSSAAFAIYKSFVKIVNAEDSPYLRATRSISEKGGQASLWQPTATNNIHDFDLSKYNHDVCRVRVSALLDSVDIRLQLSSLARVFASAIAAILPPLDAPKPDELWQARREMSARRFTILALAILRSARRDVDLAVNLGTSHKLHRLVLRAEVAAAEVSFHSNRLYTLVDLAGAGAQDPSLRKKAVEGIANARQQAEERLDGAFKRYESGVAAEDDHIKMAAERAAEIIGLEWKFFKGILKADALGYKTIMGSELSEAKDILRSLSRGK